MVRKTNKTSRYKPVKTNQIGSLSKSYKAIIKAIGDETRFQILLLLKKGPKTVPQISSELKRKRYDFYYHLNYLESQGIVKSKTLGRANRSRGQMKNKRKSYSLTRQGKEQLKAFSQLIGAGKV